MIEVLFLLSQRMIEVVACWNYLFWETCRIKSFVVNTCNLKWKTTSYFINSDAPNCACSRAFHIFTINKAYCKL